ncbi:beta-1,4 N-acetylgalactosaminyltransferase 2 [Tachyglossus aculeatus]|uniref:beta-1,4 N-acetylgalactosaminyltransferase 2 n=1 Tax=Tachyglossus aculeatus TaxID=9261 RepID=UPI0018F45BA6|nr:beta-1,4 N-acetylgalactosaminyltransferase 2 [Tachyglossus aculeatus]
MLEQRTRRRSLKFFRKRLRPPWLLNSPVRTTALVLAVVSVGFLLWISWESQDFERPQPRIDSSRRPFAPTQALDPSRLRLLPKEKHSQLFRYNGLWLFPKKQCECQNVNHPGNYNYQDAYNPSDVEAVKARRQREFWHFQRREGLPRPPMLVAQPNLPFSYPILGVEVMPLHTVQIPGLALSGSGASTNQIILKASLGTLNSLADTPDDVVQGRGGNSLIISTNDLELLNFILQHVTYTSTVFRLSAVDIVSMELGNQVARFPVTIRHPITPILYDPGPERKISSLVTVATKTFLRYHKLQILLRSIRDHYPDLRVIVADDNAQPEKIDDPLVEQYTMPFGKGWFAGRNLAVSQVTTKYILWVDDDYIFTNDTRIDRLVDVLEKTDLDVVGGRVGGNLFQFKLLLEPGEDGDCIHWRAGSFHPLPDFPSCVVTSGVVNFFLAHTHKLLSVGFDPKLQRVAHSEFFIDGLGSLLVGSCSDVGIGHQPKSPISDPKEATAERSYRGFRANTQEQVRFKLALHFFKNHLKCFTRG